MSFIPSGGDAIQLQSKRSYIATTNFLSNIFTYSNVFNNQTLAYEGTLRSFAAAGVASSDCVAGRVLRETGRRLIPGAYPGVSTVMVSVGDEISLLSGFIDPNSPVFAPFSTDLPNFPLAMNTLQQAINPANNSNDAGAPVYTTGTVTAGQAYLNATSSLGATLPAAKISLDTINYRYFTGIGGGAGANSTIIAPSAVPPAGGQVTFLFSTINTATVLFNRPCVAASGGALSNSAAGSMSITFLSDGSNLIETSRVVAATGNVY